MDVALHQEEGRRRRERFAIADNTALQARMLALNP
jgi:hypothetical protein